MPHAMPPGVSCNSSSTSTSGCTGSVTTQMMPPPFWSRFSPASRHLSMYGCLMVRIFLAALRTCASSSSDFLCFRSYRKMDTSCPSFLPACIFHGEALRPAY